MFFHIRIITGKKTERHVSGVFIFQEYICSTVEIVKQINEKGLAPCWVILILQRSKAKACIIWRARPIEPWSLVAFYLDG
jgi:hypothetical protein